MNFKDELMNDAQSDIYELLDNTNPKNIYLTSDWHFFKNHYKHEANYVNTQKILTWCRQNIKDDDIFMYLGDISFRYANDKDKKKSAELMKSIPGNKILILGNHDIMAGYDYYSNCGFDYIFMRLDWHNIVFTHKPVNMELMPDDYLNIHGHIHNMKTYNTCDGKKNINVYPLWYNGLPTTLDYVLKHKEKLTKDNVRSNWTNIGEASLDVLEDYDNIVKSINESNNKIYNKISIENAISKYKEKYPRLKHIRVSKNTKGYGLIDNNNLIGIINVETKSNGEKWIEALEVFEPYKQQGYSTILLDIAINDLNATLLSVSKNNTLAKQIYDRYGFNTIKDDDSMYYMSINESNISKNIYHLSDNNFNDKTINPRVPSNYFTKNEYEDRKTARVCFSTSIEGCLRAESENITDKEFFVHIPDGDYKMYNPTIKEVPDVKLTNEVWIKEPVKLKCIGKIKVIDSIDKPLSYKYGNNTANLYDWKYIWIEKINESNRSDLPDNEFGIPEDRKYPLDTKKHVNSAIRLFGHAEEDKKEMLAKRIKSAADKYDLSIAKNTQVYKYLNETTNNDFIIPEEVNNIVFDMGGVLIGDSTLEAIKSHPNIPDKYAKTIYDLIIEKMFYRKDNANLTTASVEKAKEYFYSILPEEIKPYINDIFETYDNGLYLYNFVDELLNLFKAYGYKIYYLSNWDRWTLDLEKEFFEPLLSKFDGGVFSAECNMEKPSISIYKHFLNKFNLTANECLFFDDKKENVDAAILCGMHSIIFNDKETPLKIFKSFNSNKHKLLDNPNEFIPIIKNNELSYININRIKYWYGSDIKLSIILNRDLCVPSLYQIINRDATPDKITHIYVPDKDSKSVYIGSIIGLSDGGWKWVIQYPLYINYNNEIITKPINENALNAMNPIIGTVTKPYVLKMMNDNSIMSNKTYAFSPDIISDKYLVINENGYLEVVDSSILDNMVVEEYEFIGDMEKLNKINEAYKNNKIVDNTFFYTTLTDKPLLTEDQIDYDPLFKKVNFYVIKEKYLSEIATLHDKYLEASNQSLYNIDTLSKNNEFVIRNDINGKYIYNENTNRRSDSIDRNESFTKEMYESTKW